jgi:hypothetical protein
MNWRDDPASEKQLTFLKLFGFTPDRPLTKGEASDLIAQFSEDPERQLIRDKNQVGKIEREYREREQDLAHHLHLEYEDAKRAAENAERGEIRDAKMYLRDAQNERLCFWEDTIREPEDGSGNEQAVKLYFAQGYRFEMPSKKEIQAILDALDADSPTWDKDIPEYFFQTLEHNFPGLLRTHIDLEALKVRLEIYSQPDE